MVVVEKRAVPELRFPGFDRDWEENHLGDFLKEYHERVSAITELPIYSSSREGLKPQKEYFDDRKLENEGEYGVVPRNYFTYRHMSDDSTFKFNINKVADKIVVSKEYPVFRTENIDSFFLLCKLNFGSDFKKFAIMQKLGGTRTRLYYKHLCNWKTLIPSLPEQQKIAIFLGAVDDKLTVLRCKRELLQDHKRGIMQKIFSRELCFKRDDGTDFPNWEEKRFGEVCSRINSGGTPSSEVKRYWGGSCPWITGADFVGNSVLAFRRYITEEGIKNSSTFVASKGDLLLVTRTGVGKIAIASFDTAISQDITAVSFHDNVNEKFVFFYLQNFQKFLLRMNQGTSINGIVRSDLVQIPLNIPLIDEQQKIADFLTAIDIEIEMVTQQIEQIETFKKGLLQKMFV